MGPAAASTRSISHPPSCWPVRRGRTPALKLLLFIHRLCLPKPLPSGALLPPTCPVTSFRFQDSLCSCSLLGCGSLGGKGGEVRLPWPGLSAGSHFPWFGRRLGPPPSVRPGVAEGTGRLVFPKCLARWWVRRVTCFCGNIVGFGYGGSRVFSATVSPALAPGLGLAPPHHPQPPARTSRPAPAAGGGEERPRGGALRAGPGSPCARALCTRLHNKRM